MENDFDGEISDIDRSFQKLSVLLNYVLCLNEPSVRFGFGWICEPAAIVWPPYESPPPIPKEEEDQEMAVWANWALMTPEIPPTPPPSPVRDNSDDPEYGNFGYQRFGDRDQQSGMNQVRAALSNVARSTKRKFIRCRRYASKKASKLINNIRSKINPSIEYQNLEPEEAELRAQEEPPAEEEAQVVPQEEDPQIVERQPEIIEIIDNVQDENVIEIIDDEDEVIEIEDDEQDDDEDDDDDVEIVQIPQDDNTGSVQRYEAAVAAYFARIDASVGRGSLVAPPRTNFQRDYLEFMDI